MSKGRRLNRSVDGLPYPLVRCGKHGHAEPGYGVCEHVLNEGAIVASREPATATKLGVIACVVCAVCGDRDTLRLACAQCCRQRGYLPKDVS